MNFLENAINVICHLWGPYTKNRARSRPGDRENGLVICSLLKTLWGPNPPIRANQGRQITYLFCLSYSSNLRENGFLKPPRNVCWCMNAVQLKFFFSPRVHGNNSCNLSVKIRTYGLWNAFEDDFLIQTVVHSIPHVTLAAVQLAMVSPSLSLSPLVSQYDRQSVLTNPIVRWARWPCD